MTGTKKKRRTPPKHLKNSGGRERRPARPNDRGEAARRQSGFREEQSDAEPRHSGGRPEAVPQTPDNTRIFYEKLLPLARRSHKLNQQRMHTGVAWLFALPVILYIVRNLTDSSKIAFLIFWIVGMFIIAAFLVMVAYQDHELQKNLDELQEYVPGIEDARLDKLTLVSPESNKWISESAEHLLRRANAILADSEEKGATADA